MQKIGPVSSFPLGSVTELNLNVLNLLLINQDSHFYLVENKCGHFGVPLINGEITGSDITCSQHGIRFSMITGEVLNRNFESCDKIKIFEVIQQDDDLFYLMPDS